MTSAQNMLDFLKSASIVPENAQIHLLSTSNTYKYTSDEVIFNSGTRKRALNLLSLRLQPKNGYTTRYVNPWCLLY